jgi:hypothetical protein
MLVASDFLPRLNDIWWALDENLLDTTTYVQETEKEAQVAAHALFTEIYQWTRTHQVCDSLKEDHLKYIRYWINQNLSDPFGYFYLTIKIHKGPLSTRPVCSDCTSLVSIPSGNGSIKCCSPSLLANLSILRTRSP